MRCQHSAYACLHAACDNICPPHAFLRHPYPGLNLIATASLWNSAHQAIPDLNARIRNVQLLVEDLPWAHKPLLLALADLFAGIGSNPSPGSSAPSRAPNAVDEVSPAAFLTEGVTVVDETEGELDVSEGVTTSGVAIRDVAETLAPALLRYPPAPNSSGDAAGAGGAAGGRRPDWEEELAAAAVVELILAEQKRVLEGMRAEHNLR